MKISLKQTINLAPKTRTSYNKRNVRYEDIHNLNRVSFSEYISILNIENNYRILDHGCGYGAVTNEICKHYSNKKLFFVLQDVSNYQIERAKKELSWIKDNMSFEYFIKELKLCGFDSNYFDIAYSKLVLQEMPLIKQVEEVVELKRIVKENGYIILWLLWPAKEYAPLFRDIIREKDKIAKLTTLVKNRYFADSEEFAWMLSKAGIDINADVEFFDYHPLVYESEKQLTGDFKNDIKCLNIFNDFIRKRINDLSPENQKTLCYNDKGENIEIQIPQKVIKIRNTKQ